MNNDDKKDESTNNKNDFRGCLTVTLGIMGFGTLLALVSKNFHEETMAVFGLLIAGGILYALVKHTEFTLQIIAFVVLISVIGGVFSYCSRHERAYEGPGVGFR